MASPLLSKVLLMQTLMQMLDVSVMAHDAWLSGSCQQPTTACLCALYVSAW